MIEHWNLARKAENIPIIPSLSTVRVIEITKTKLENQMLFIY